MSNECTAGCANVEEPKQMRLKELLHRYAGMEGALIPVLQKAQEIYGYLPREVMEQIGKALAVPPAKVYGVATFYAQFRLAPVGRNVVKVCMGTACHVRGGDKVYEAIEKTLGIADGETTADLRYTLELVACIGACGLAPVMSVNDKIYGRLTPENVRSILADYK